MQFSGSTNRAADLSEFNQQFAQYEGAVKDNIKLPELQLFLKANEDYLKYWSVNDRVFRLCDSMNAATAEGTKTLDAIKQIVATARISPAPIESFPRDVMAGVIGPMLPPQDLANLSLASTAMRAFMRVPLEREWAEVRAEITIGPEKWDKLLAKRGTDQDLDINYLEVPPLPADIDQILKSDCPFCEGKKVFQTHRLVLMPGGLSINQQGRLMRHLRGEGQHGTVFSEYSWDAVFEQIGDTKVDRPYWALVTTDVVPNSRNKSIEEQKKLIEEKGYVVPSTSEAITLVTMDKECSGEKEGYLLSTDPWTYTNCAEKVQGQQLVVGGFARYGLTVSYYDSDHDHVGVLALRKF